MVIELSAERPRFGVVHHTREYPVVEVDQGLSASRVFLILERLAEPRALPRPYISTQA